MRKKKIQIGIGLLALTGLLAIGSLSVRADSATDSLYQYYRVNRTFKVWTAGIKAKHWITLPKGMIVQAAKQTQLSSNGKSMNVAEFNFRMISYATRKNKLHMKKTWRNWTDATTRTPQYLTAVKPPKVLLTDHLSASRQSGFLSNRADNRGNMVIATVDGYLEYYQKLYPTGDSNFKPQSYAKITKIRQSGNVKYFYYRHHIKGLKDQAVRKSGKYRYRLKEVNLNKKVTLQYPSVNDGLPSTYFVYTLSNQKYYVPTGEFK
ncbi:hypothetical protein [Lentilactobacillus diolivorans]|uniref:Uncharacterized protein n=2 Tax=Lentilactobacillus diolivorans TaxID=179838 RepID=A0A0R1SFF7_9LACO|nr:hypothetical protein [Lentilactobacillus diolivorans]KRL65058.1 hypothetical protein FC85_GL000553 [Lentilactobacillus diolivorans DSM 14421]GEP23531.1 hypothetical protein LDI01_11240 [Lentilactobacillus diolivorans]